MKNYRALLLRNINLNAVITICIPFRNGDDNSEQNVNEHKIPEFIGLKRRRLVVFFIITKFLFIFHFLFRSRRRKRLPVVNSTLKLIIFFYTRKH